MRRRSESAIPARHINEQILLTNLHAFCGDAHSQPEKGARRKREGLLVGIFLPGSGWYTHRLPPTLSIRPLHAQRPSSACAQEKDATETNTCARMGMRTYILPEHFGCPWQRHLTHHGPFLPSSSAYCQAGLLIASQHGQMPCMCCGKSSNPSNGQGLVLEGSG